MLPEFLVFLGEELNQSIPDSLKEEVSKKFKSPSPAPSSKTLSVQSLASQQDMLESQRPATRDLRLLAFFIKNVQWFMFTFILKGLGHYQGSQVLLLCSIKNKSLFQLRLRREMELALLRKKVQI